mmetsp:Transcript_10370/g.19878  ORF Transcript_10370/g.19878 Transcript_10370/m.19878 type:complete len:97 (-) Transcript_10370:166-456(-)
MLESSGVALREHQNASTIHDSEDLHALEIFKAAAKEFSQREKKEIGAMCKRMIDYGRIAFLRRLGFNCTLIRYVPANVTTENILLCGQRARVRAEA